jgi:hypothetical protein
MDLVRISFLHDRIENREDSRIRISSALLPALSTALAVATTEPAPEDVKTEVVEYTDCEQFCEGFLAWDDAAPGKRPGVVVVHEGKGLGDDAKADRRSWEAMKAFFAEGTKVPSGGGAVASGGLGCRRKKSR